MRPVGAPDRLDVRIDEKTYRTADGEALVAIRGLSFSVLPNTFTCVIGPSGCGKTTALRIIMGIDRDYVGAIETSGSPRRLAAVFQEPRLLPWRTAEENIRLALSGRLRGRDLWPFIEPLGLTDMLKRHPAELSLGLARRVALARALAVEPGLLVLDEPFASLDEATAARLRALLIDLWQQRPTTVLMVTHNLREAIELADHLIILAPRPTHVIGTELVTIPRAERSPAAVAAFREALGQRHPGLVVD